MSRIDRVELTAFSFQVPDLALGSHGAAGVGNLIYRKPAARCTVTRYALRICCDDGAEGAYVTHWVGTPSTFGQMQMLAPNLIGRDPEQREIIWDDLKREARAYDHMGHGTDRHRALGPGRPQATAFRSPR